MKMKSFYYSSCLLFIVLAVFSPIATTYGFILKPTTTRTTTTTTYLKPAFTSHYYYTSPIKQSSPSTSSTTTTKLQTFISHVDFIAPEIWTSLLPTSLGLVKSEYGFSYAYGFGTALSALSILRRYSSTSSNPSLLLGHTLAIVFYGLRLNLFLFLRTKLSQRQRDMIERIEERSTKREVGSNRFVKRTPILLSSGLLYYALAAPAILTAKLLSSSVDIVLPVWVVPILKTLIGIMWFGFGIAAIGDITKTYVKQRQRDENYLVTSGIFSILRHPNYFGEMIGWTANSLCGIVAASILFMQNSFTVSTLSQWIGQGLGWVGIILVLLRASTSLEKRQNESYGNDIKYQDWIKSSWKGPTLPEKKREQGEEEHEIDLNDIEEDSGSGI